MKCRFDSTGIFSTLCSIFTMCAILSAVAFLYSLCYWDQYTEIIIISLIVCIISSAAVILFAALEGGTVYARSDKLVITHSFLSRKVLVSKIDYSDIEYADYSVKPIRTNAGFFYYLYTLKIKLRNKKVIELNRKLHYLDEDRPLRDPDGYKQYINKLPMTKLCGYINERAG